MVFRTHFRRILTTEVSMKFLLPLVVVLLVSGVAEARPRRTYTYTNSHSSASFSGSDQERCQQEADYMAAHGISGHVGSCIGSFEGVGYGSSPNCNTCTPGSNMRLTGDASARGRNGMWYRVRSWR